MGAETTGIWPCVFKAYFVALNSKPEKFCFKALIFLPPRLILYIY